jgi:hypothetical protein
MPVLSPLATPTAQAISWEVSLGTAHKGGEDIILCPHTCQTIQADTNAQVNIAFGCPTEVN